MERPSKSPVPKRFEGQFITLNVKGKKGSVPQRLLGELLTCLVQAMHDALIQGASKAERSRPRTRVTLSTPIGPVAVSLFEHRVGSWRQKYRHRFASALVRHWNEVSSFLARSLATGEPLPKRRLKTFSEYFLGEAATNAQLQFAHQKISEFVARHGASSPPDIAARDDARKFVQYIKENGFPSKAIAISDGGVRVNLLRVAAAAKVTLAAINRYGRSARLQDELNDIAS